MTLNEVIAVIFRFLRNSTDFQTDYITVVEDRPVYNVRKSLSPTSNVLLLAIAAIAEHLVKYLTR